MSKPLQINDLFWTVQGEGRWTGHRALFVRMPFCNYDCPWCDTEYNSYKLVSEADFEIFCNREPARFAVLTGGEPTLHKDIHRIIEILKNNNFYIACETNGSNAIPEGIDFPTVSPKKFTRNKYSPYFVDERVFAKAQEWKYVVDKDFDFKILDRHKTAAPHGPLEQLGLSSTPVFSLSPEHSDMKNNTQKIMDYITMNPSWKLSLQTHKWIDIP